MTKITNTNDKTNFKKNILLLATGGTIAGVGSSGKQTGYSPGTLTAKDLLKSCPGVEDLANITIEQICNINSDDITEKEWLLIAKRINNAAENEDIDGIVITHGTDTMEETAYFLDLVCKTKKPIVLTGSMRPASSLSADGPLNMYQAILVAANDKSYDKPVVAVMNDIILSARTFQKTSTSSTGSMKSDELGILGYIRDHHVNYNDDGHIFKFKDQTEFCIDHVESLPNVNIVYFNVDADTEILKLAIKISDAVVIAGAGAGEYNLEFKKIIEAANIPIIISTRTSSGPIVQESLLVKDSVATSYLNPQKAVVLAKVALMENKNKTTEELVRIFNTY